VINSSSFSSDSMPLDKKSRVLIERAVGSYLRRKKEATSAELFLYLTKVRGIKALYSVKQVAEVCRAWEHRGVVLPRLVKGERGRVTLWQMSPDFYRQHPGERIFGEHISQKEIDEARKRRVRAAK